MPQHSKAHSDAEALVPQPARPGTPPWWVNSGLHRVDGPALVNDEAEWWFQNGLLHRMNGPAIIWNTGEREFYVNGLRHRLDGPAIIDPDGAQQFWCNDMLHRWEGPAVISADGSEEHWRLGRRFDPATGQYLNHHPDAGKAFSMEWWR